MSIDPKKNEEIKDDQLDKVSGGGFEDASIPDKTSESDDPPSSNYRKGGVQETE